MCCAETPSGQHDDRLRECIGPSPGPFKTIRRFGTRHLELARGLAATAAVFRGKKFGHYALKLARSPSGFFMSAASGPDHSDFPRSGQGRRGQVREVGLSLPLGSVWASNSANSRPNVGPSKQHGTIRGAPHFISGIGALTLGDPRAPRRYSLLF
jgi:hypothetical protein